MLEIVRRKEVLRANVESKKIGAEKHEVIDLATFVGVLMPTALLKQLGKLLMTQVSHAPFGDENKIVFLQVVLFSVCVPFNRVLHNFLGCRWVFEL